jgi:hypothetical protein
MKELTEEEEINLAIYNKFDEEIHNNIFLNNYPTQCFLNMLGLFIDQLLPKDVTNFYKSIILLSKIYEEGIKYEKKR